jgi:transcriptional/translational regulatory protein YebC/TACO1
LEITSDNRNRTVAEIRSLLTKNHGNMSEAGAVAWQFHKKGLVAIEKGKVEEDTLLSLALDAGAEDVKVGEKSYEVLTSPQDFEAVKKALVDAKLTRPWPKSLSSRRTRFDWKRSLPSKC